MADGIVATVTGVPELRAAVDRAIVNSGRRSLETVTEVGKLLQGMARAKAPRVSGDLAGSIELVGPTPVGAGGWLVLVGPTVPYGHRVEYGFHATDSRGATYNYAGSPYLRPAYREVRVLFRETFRKNLTAGLLE